MVLLILVIAAGAIFIAEGVGLAYLLNLRNRAIIDVPSGRSSFDFEDALS